MGCEVDGGAGIALNIEESVGLGGDGVDISRGVGDKWVMWSVWGFSRASRLGGFTGNGRDASEKPL